MKTILLLTGLLIPLQLSADDTAYQDFVNNSRSGEKDESGTAEMENYLKPKRPGDQVTVREFKRPSQQKRRLIPVQCLAELDGEMVTCRGITYVRKRN